MVSRFQTTAFLVGCLLGTFSAQSQEVPKLTLRIEQTIPVLGPTDGFHLPLKCDRAGNIYIRSARSFREPILKISPEGQKRAEFSLVAAPSWENGEFYDFAVRPDGDVYLLAARRGKNRTIEPGILQFSEQGRFRLAIELDLAPYSLNQLAVFGTGEFLISGWKRERRAIAPGVLTNAEQEHAQNLVEPLLAILNPAGEITHQIPIPEAGEKAPGEEASSIPLRAISLAAAAYGDDGFIYLMLRQENARILVLSPQSGVVRTLAVSSPSEKFSPTDLRYSSGIGLIVQFDERLDERRFDPRRGIISLINPQTGERLMDYQLTSELGGILGCHTSRGFFFVQVNGQRQLVFHRTTPR